VATGWKVHHDGLRDVRVAIHLHDEKPVVDAIRPFIVSGTRDAGQVRRRRGFCRFTGLSLAGLPVSGEKLPNLAAGH
jgi:hypothetical protein